MGLGRDVRVSLSRISWSYRAHDPSDLSPTFRWLPCLIRIVGNTRTPSHAHSPAFRFTDMWPPALTHDLWVHMSWTQTAFRTCAVSKDASPLRLPHDPIIPFRLSPPLDTTNTTPHHSTAVRIFQAWGEESRAQNPKLLANRCASFFGFLPSGRPSLNTGILAVAVAGCFACPFEPPFLTLCTAVALCLAQAICQSFAFGL
jgi:hypothetical protein